jgi:1-acyl-sn-glycerol-3-phosphate acyltransferase
LHKNALLNKQGACFKTVYNTRMKNFVRWLVRTIITLLADVEIKGYENLPKDQSYVLAVNHLGFIDAPLAFYGLDRWDLYVLVADKWAQNPILNWLGNKLNFIYVDRYNNDIKAIRRVMEVMQENNVLAIAPEGTRSRAGSMIEARPGVSYLAAKLKRPIVPVGIWGTEDKVFWKNILRLRRNKVYLQTGPAFTLPPIPKDNRDQALKDYTDEIMCRIAVILPEQYRGVYANHQRLKELLAEKQTGAH